MATTSIGAPGVVFPDGTTQATAANPNVVTTIYYSPSTWTKPSTVKDVRVTLVAGGGGGGSARSSGPSPQTVGGGGGAAGGYGFFAAPSIPGPVAVTVGSGGPGGAVPGAPGSSTPGVTGGTSSFGALISATGGGGGSGGSGNGAAGAITSSPTVIGYRGTAGGYSAPLRGGDSFSMWGYGGANPSGPGSGYGSGGGGGGVTGLSTITGGTGASGFVIVEEFY